MKSSNLKIKNRQYGKTYKFFDKKEPKQLLKFSKKNILKLMGVLARKGEITNV